MIQLIKLDEPKVIDFAFSSNSEEDVYVSSFEIEEINSERTIGVGHYRDAAPSPNSEYPVENLLLALIYASDKLGASEVQIFLKKSQKGEESGTALVITSSLNPEGIIIMPRILKPDHETAP